MSRGNAKMLEEEVLGKTVERKEIGDMSEYKLINCLLLTAVRSLLRGFRESEEEEILAISSFCGSEEEKISSAKKAEELCNNMGKEGVGCMKRRDESGGIRRDVVGWKVDVSNC